MASERVTVWDRDGKKKLYEVEFPAAVEQPLILVDEFNRNIFVRRQECEGRYCLENSFQGCKKV